MKGQIKNNSHSPFFKQENLSIDLDFFKKASCSRKPALLFDFPYASVLYYLFVPILLSIGSTLKIFQQKCKTGTVCLHMCSNII